MSRRVTFKDINGLNEYSVPINPITFESMDDDEINQFSSVDGRATFSKSMYDSRTRTMEWKSLPNKTPYNTMVSTLKTYKGTRRRLYLNDLSGSTTESGYSNIIVTNVQTNWTLGPATADANLKYDYVRLTYVLA